MSKRNHGSAKATDPQAARDTASQGGARYFGPKLRELREQYHSRLAEASNAALLGKAGLTASAVVGCLRRGGYALSLPSYTEIESGANLPRDAVRFLAVTEQCLSLRSEEKRDLERRLAYDVLHARLGDLATALLPPLETPAPEQHRTATLGLVLRDLRTAARLSLDDLAAGLFEQGVTISPEARRVLERLKVSPATYLADQLGEFEQSDLQAPWPFDLEPHEFIAKVAQALPAHLLAQQRLTYALTLDELGRQAST